MAQGRPMTERLAARQNTDFNARRKDRAQAQIESDEPALASTDPSQYNLENTEDQIKFFRAQLAAGKTPLQKAQRNMMVQKRDLRNAYTPRKTRLAQKEQRREVSTELGKLNEQERIAETDIARRSPEYAQPAFKAAALNEAVTGIKERVDPLIERKVDYESRLSNPNISREDRAYYEDALDVLNAELGEYQGALGGDENTLIKNWFSGYTVQKAEYEASRTQSNVESTNTFNTSKTSDPELQQIISILNLSPNVTQMELQQAIKRYNSQQEQAQKAVSAWQKANPTETLIFDKAGNVVGVDSGALGMSLSLENYNKIAAKERLASPKSLNNLQLLSGNEQTNKKGSSMDIRSLFNNNRSFNLDNSGLPGIRFNSNNASNRGTTRSTNNNIISRLLVNFKEKVYDAPLKLPLFFKSKELGNKKYIDVKSTTKDFVKGTEKLPTLSKIYAKAEELEKLSKGKVNKQGEWIGSEKSFEFYQKKLANYEDLKQKYDSLSTRDKYKQGAIRVTGKAVNLLPVTVGQLSLGVGAGVIGGKAVKLGIKGVAYGASQYPRLAKVGGGGLAALDLLLTGKAVKDLRNPNIPEETKLLNIGLAGLSAYNLAGLANRGFRSLPKGTGSVSSITTESRAEQFVRKRATVILEDSKGNILYHVDKNTGMAILPGGAIDKGESALKAAQRELFEETGLRMKLKPYDKVITEREANYIYRVTVPDLNVLIPKLTPQAKEVAGFRAINPGIYTGKSQLNVFGSKGIRAEDLYIGSRIKIIREVNNEIAQLTVAQKAALTEQAKVELVKLYGAQALSLKKENLLREYLLLRKGMQLRKLYINPVAEVFERRGSPAFLKKRVQRPSLRSPSSIVDFLTGRKPGQFKKFQKEAPIVVGFGSRYDVPFKELKKYSKNLNTYLHGSPGQIQGTEEFYVDVLTGRSPLNKGKQISVDTLRKKKSFKVLSEKGKRGEQVLYFQPPTTPGGEEAYLGASYLGLLTKAPKNVEEVTIGFTKGTPTIYRVKAQAGKDLIFTNKARRGVEFEVGATPGTVFKITGKPQIINLAGKKVKIQNIEMVKASTSGLKENQIQQGLSNLNRMNPQQQKSFIARVKRETGRDYSSYIQGGFKVDPVNALNQGLIPVKASRQGRGNQSKNMQERKVDRRSEQSRGSSEKINNLMVGPSRTRYREQTSKYKGSVTRYKNPNASINYLVPSYVVPKKPTKPYKPTPYKEAPKPRYGNPGSYITPPPTYRITPRGRTGRGSIDKREEPKIRRRPGKKGRVRYVTLPTITQLIAGYKGSRPRTRITGFEAIRII